MAKKENDTYTVQINLVFVLKAKDEMDAQDKVTRAAAMLRPAGTESRKVKWISTIDMMNTTAIEPGSVMVVEKLK